MTIQSKAGTSTHEIDRPSVWERLAPFLDVIGAVLIFGSWVFSHSLLQHAQDQANTHQAIIDRVRAFRLYDDFGQRISDMQSDIVRTRDLVEDAIASGNSPDSKAASLADPPSWTGMSAAQIGELNDFAQALARYAEQLSSSGAITQSLKTAESGAVAITEAFDSARDEYDRLVENRKISSSPAVSESAIEAEQEELGRRVDRLWHDYDTAKQSMMDVGDELLRKADAESTSASQLATHCERLSWALYILGTLIILFGRAKSVLAAKKTSEDS
jgi:hypothetical protein